jgi:hypothetical protein
MIHRFHPAQRRSLLLLAPALLTLALVSAGCRDRSRPSTVSTTPPREITEAAAPQARPEVLPPPVEDGADLVMTADEFLEEVSRKDADAWDAKFRGKTIDVKGVVSQLPRNAGGEVIVVLAVEGKPFGLSCHTTETDVLDKVTPGQTVTMRGKAAADILRGDLVASRIVDVTGPRPPVITAEALAKEHEAEREKTLENYNDKWMFITGEVIAKQDPAEADSVRLDVRGTSKVQVVFFLVGGQKPLAKGITTGMKIRMLACYSSGLQPARDPSRIVFNNCYVAGTEK